MDANGTRFHLLLGESDWERCLDASEPATTLREHFRAPATECPEHDGAGFGWDAVRHQLTLRPCLPVFTAAPNDRAPEPGGADRRGAARDVYGSFYWIAESGTELRVIPVATGLAAHFWSSGDPAPPARYGEFQSAGDPAPAPATRVSGLAITIDHYLVAGTLEPPGLLVFDLHGGGRPQQFCWDAPFAPFDLAARPDGGVWILDRANRRYWGLDRHFRPLLLDGPAEDIERTSDFRPSTGDPDGRRCGRRLPRPVALDGTAANGLDPIAIEGLPDGSVLILTGTRSGASRLFRDGAAGRFGELRALEPFTDAAYDLAVVSEPRIDSRLARVYAATTEGNQAFAFDLRADAGAPRLALVPDYLPMRLFGGKGLVSDGGRVYYDFFDGWIPLEAMRRPRYAASAALMTPVLDGREPACVWHRLMLDGCIPPDAAVRVRSRAADERSLLGSAAWQTEPEPYLRRDGSELPFGPERRGEHEGTWELLFQRARGRYLQLELSLTGDERVTPRIQALRAYYPRFSYLGHYLPGLYRDDETSASFLDRFLANLEGFYTATEDRVAAVQALFTVRGAPREALDWLGSWFGVALDPSWTEAKRRLFLEHAIDFFRSRGTVRGLRAALRLALDERVDESLFADRCGSGMRMDRIRIVERYRTRRLPAAVAGDPTVEAPREVILDRRWRPSQGRTRLIELYAASLAGAGLAGDASTFPLRAPGATAAHWRSFSQDVLGFVPSATAGDATAWREFLARRYHQERALAAAYRVLPASVPSFDRLDLPAQLPPDGAALADWYEFESIVLPIRRAAHRFSILLPASRGRGETEAARRERLDLVKRIVDLEKPAHTVFDVKYYWALFRLGEARLGHDTVADRGGRAPELMPPLRLGAGALSESHLAAGHPLDAAARIIVGRDALAADVSKEMQG